MDAYRLSVQQLMVLHNDPTFSHNPAEKVPQDFDGLATLLVGMHVTSCLLLETRRLEVCYQSGPKMPRSDLCTSPKTTMSFVYYSVHDQIETI